MVFPDLLILQARTSDTDGDRRLTERDAVWLFAYDLAKGELRRLSPEGYSVANASKTRPDTILMLLTAEDQSGKAAVYQCNPSEPKGKFIVNDLAP